MKNVEKTLRDTDPYDDVEEVAKVEQTLFDLHQKASSEIAKNRLVPKKVDAQSAELEIRRSKIKEQLEMNIASLEAPLKRMKEFKTKAEESINNILSKEIRRRTGDPTLFLSNDVVEKFNL